MKGNTKREIEEMDAVLIELRGKGLTYAEIERITGRDAHNIRKSCVRLGIAYAPGEDHTGRKTERQFAEELKAKNPGFEYVSGYRNNQSEVVVMCTEKGHTFTRNAWNLRSPHVMKCPKCQEERRAEKEAERIAAEINRVTAAGLNRMLKYITKRESKVIIECHECGAKIVKTKTSARLYCSKLCQSRAQDRRHRQKRDERIRNKNNRQVVDLSKLYKKSKGICALCGKKTDWNDYVIKLGADGRETFVAGDYYPSLDHIIPLAKGGENTWSNSQLAHRICNSIKGAH